MDGRFTAKTPAYEKNCQNDDENDETAASSRANNHDAAVRPIVWWGRSARCSGRGIWRHDDKDVDFRRKIDREDWKSELLEAARQAAIANLLLEHRGCDIRLCGISKALHLKLDVNRLICASSCHLHHAA